MSTYPEATESSLEPSPGQEGPSEQKRWGERSDTAGWKWDGDRQVWVSKEGMEIKAPPPPKRAKRGGQLGNRGGPGRKEKYKPGYARVARKAFETGSTRLEVADMLGVTESTLDRWRLKYPRFARAFVLGKEACVDRVERSLYERAVGYEFNAEKAVMTRNGQETLKWREHLPPDTAAALAYLKNMRPDRWRERTHHEHHISPYDGIDDVAELRALLTKQARALGLIAPPDTIVDVTPEPECAKQEPEKSDDSLDRSRDG